MELPQFVHLFLGVMFYVFSYLIWNRKLYYLFPSFKEERVVDKQKFVRHIGVFSLLFGTTSIIKAFFDNFPFIFIWFLLIWLLLLFGKRYYK
ncbi:DUF3784 domain-containing protein [Metabacillus halosaccharovorans]|uniref:DUF3784 domain-containing protein n=2 Tax=Bacillaceae TaxID=186817 RepID=UPI0034CE73BD